MTGMLKQKFIKILTAYLTFNIVLMTGIIPVGSITAANVTVTIDTSTPIGQSKYVPGITHVDNSLRSGDATAINSAKQVVAGSTVFENTHIMAWGAPDPWPDPAQPEPNNWAYLDARVNLANQLGGTPIITLLEAPWWMKGQRQSDGTTKLIPD